MDIVILVGILEILTVRRLFYHGISPTFTLSHRTTSRSRPRAAPGLPIVARCLDTIRSIITVNWNFQIIET